MTIERKVGDRVASWNSGLIYIVKDVVPLDLVGTTAYRVRRLRGGVEWGPTRVIGGCGLCSEPRVEATLGRLY